MSDPSFTHDKLTDSKKKKKSGTKCWTTKASGFHSWGLSHNPQLLVISQQLEIKCVIGSENNVGIADCGLEWQIPLGDTSLSQKETLDLKAMHYERQHGSF